jgi:hypothetical protein
LSDNEQVLFDSLRVRMDNQKKRSDAWRKWWVVSHGWWAPVWNSNARKTWDIDVKQQAKQQANNKQDKDKVIVYNNISSYEDIYSIYYKWGRGINPAKCDPLLDWLLSRWVTLDDIKKGIVLYNSICRMRWSDGFRYTKNFDTWLKEYRKPTEDELEETLTTVIGMHKEKGKSDPKYKDSKRASVLWKELCDTFWKDRVNAIFKHEGSWPSVRFT